MIRITRLVLSRIDDLAEYYEEELRYEALLYLRDAVAEAKFEISKDPETYSSYPSTYWKLEDLGLRWRKFHRYWFGWTVVGEVPIVTNFDFDENEMPERIVRGGIQSDWP